MSTNMRTLLSSLVVAVAILFSASSARADEVFQEKGNFDAKFPDRTGCWPITTVPAGKRLVLEYVSAQIQVTLGPSTPKIWNVTLVVRRPAAPPVQERTFFLAPPQLAPETTKPWTVSQSLRLQVDGGWEALFCVSKNMAEGWIYGQAAVSGLLTDVD
jgi:hypothetical protein